MESTLEVISVLITREWLGIYSDRLERRPGAIDAFVGTKSLLSSIVGFHLHQGIMAVAKIPTPKKLDEVVKESLRPLLFVAVEGMTNSENLGVVVRNCVAFGVQALIVGETSSSPYLRRAVRNSMGAIFRLPVVDCGDLVETIADLRHRGMEVVAAHPHAGKPMKESSLFVGDCCIVLGSEGEGITEKTLAACSEAVAIPMKPGVDSLNVSSAAAVLLYEIARQRQLK